MSKFIGEVGNEHGKSKGAGPRRDAVQLGLDRGIAVAFDDRGLRGQSSMAAIQVQM